MARKGFSSANGVLACLALLAALITTLVTYRQRLYWDRKAGLQNWVKFKFKECSFDGGFQRCYEPLWYPLACNLLPFAIINQLIAVVTAYKYSPRDTTIEKYLPQHERNLVSLRPRHQPRLLLLKILFLVFLAYHIYIFEDHRELYGPTKGNRRTKLTHTLTWMVSIPTYTLPIILFGWAFDGWLAVGNSRHAKVASSVVVLALTFTEFFSVFSIFGTRSTPFTDLVDNSYRNLLELPFRSIVLLMYILRLPGLVWDFFGNILRNLFSSCNLEKSVLFENEDGQDVLLVRPGPIGLHVLDDHRGSGILIMESETKTLRQLENRTIVQIQTVNHEQPVTASISFLKHYKSYSRLLFIGTTKIGSNDNVGTKKER
jgi:hypothetical protein